MSTITRGVARSGPFAALALAASFMSTGADSQNLNEVLVMAHQNSNLIKSAQIQISISDENIIQAGAELMPTIGLEPSLQHSITNPSPMNSRSNITQAGVFLTARIPLYDGGVRKLAVGAAGLGKDIAELNLQATVHQVLLDAVVAFHEVIKAQSFLNLARSSLDVHEKELEAANNRFRLGAISRTELSFVESRLAAARGDLGQREGDLAIAREQFKLAVGEYPESLAQSSATPVLPPNLEEAQILANANSPAIALSRKRVDIADSMLKQAERGLKSPQFFLDGRTGVQHRLGSGGSTTRNFSIGITGQFTLSKGGAGNSLKREAAEAVNASRMNLRQNVRIVMQRVSNAWVQLDIARSTVRAASEQVEHTELAFRGTQVEASLGARSSLDVLDAEQDNLRARTSLVNARNNLSIAIYVLLGEIGILSPEVLGLDIESS